MSNRSLKKNTKGFTLIELLLYLSLASIMLAVLGGIGINVLESRVKAHSFEQVHHNAVFLSELLTQRIEQATAVNSPELLAVSSTLSLAMEDAEKNPTVFDIVDGRVHMQEGSNDPVQISSDGVLVTQLEFSNMATSGSSSFIRIVMHIDSENPQNKNAYNASSTFYTTVRTEKMP